MKAAIKYILPDPEFWVDYTLLWKESSSNSPFQSPHFIQCLTRRHEKSIALFTCYENSVLLGAAFFLKRQGTYGFLSDVKTDHNFFLIQQTCSAEETEDIFKLFFENIWAERWKLKLNYQPTWATYWQSFKKGLAQSRLFWEGVSYSVSPMLTYETKEQLHKKLTGSRNTKYKRNRLIKEQNGAIEIYKRDEDLEQWVNEFCKIHISKWSNTSTPSAYLDQRKQALLKEYLQAWYKDGVLVRFGFKIPEKRIAFCIGLIQGDTLLHHSHTYDNNFQKYSPGKVLLYYIGEWCGEEGITTLDFGEGQEKFKYNYANINPTLDRIFISRRNQYGFMLKAKLLNGFKRNSKLYSLYQKQIRPILLRLK